MESLKRCLRVAGVIGAGGLLALGLWMAIRGDAGPDDTLAPAAVAEVARFAAARGAALPAVLPPGAASIRGTRPDGLPAVLVGAEGEPTVAVCTGDAPACAGALPAGRPLARRTAGGPAVLLVLPGRRGAPAALTARAEEHWRAVPLILTRPDWVDAPAAP